ncbi:MAG: hypothetical protein ACK56F_29700, partial [bacterium]
PKPGILRVDNPDLPGVGPAVLAAEGDASAVGRPGGLHFLVGVRGDLRGRTTADGHDIDVPVAVAVGRKCHPRAVGRKRGHEVVAGIGRELRHRAAVDRLAVDVEGWPVLR